MTKKTLYLLGIALTIIIGMFLYWWICCGGCCDDEEKEQKPSTEQVSKIPVVPKPTANSFSIKDGDFSINLKDNFGFGLGDFNFRTPVAEKLNAGILSLKDHLMANDNKAFGITGLYRTDENTKYDGAWPNLGLARANSVKNYLVSLGIPSNRLNTFGKLDDDLVPNESNVFIGPLSYNIATTADEEKEAEAAALKALGDKIRANPLVMYFQTGQAAINLTAEQRQKIADIAKYIDKVEGATCNIVGHTDNSGARAINIRLGQERADFARDYLVRNGILKTKINTSSKGPDEPVATNDTKEGQAKNRRTEVTIN